MKTAVRIAIALGMTATAHAADLTVPPPEPAPEAAYNWTGLYIGVHGGYGVGDFSSAPTDSYDGLKPDGFFGGGQAGYNYQFANNVVLGIEADVSFGDLKDNISAQLGSPPDALFDLGYATKIDTFGTVRARAGYAFDRFLPYVTGGLAWGRAQLDFENTITADGEVRVHNAASDKQTFTGWTVGAGLEYAVTKNVTAKVEYLYADLGSQDFDLGTPVPGDLTLQTVKFGLNYKF